MIARRYIPYASKGAAALAPFIQVRLYRMSEHHFLVTTNHLTKCAIDPHHSFVWVDDQFPQGFIYMARCVRALLQLYKLSDILTVSQYGIHLFVIIDVSGD